MHAHAAVFRLLPSRVICSMKHRFNLASGCIGLASVNMSVSMSWCYSLLP